MVGRIFYAHGTAEKSSVRKCQNSAVLDRAFDSIEQGPAPLLPPISLLGLVHIWSRYIIGQSHCPLIHSSTWQTLTEGSAQPPEHQNAPPLHTLTRSPNRFRSLIFGFRKSMSLRIRPLVIQLHAATPLDKGDFPSNVVPIAPTGQSRIAPNATQATTAPKSAPVVSWVCCQLSKKFIP